MNPAPVTESLNLVGATLNAIQSAAEGVLLSVTLPRAADSMILPETLTLGIFPVLTVNLPPGTRPSPEVMERAKRSARPEIIVRTHRGPLPEPLRAIATDLAPELFAPVLHQVIASTAPPRDGSQGMVLLFGSGEGEEFEGYALQIDLAGVNLVKYERVKAEATSGDPN